jgi:hypothetical protein
VTIRGVGIDPFGRAPDPARTLSAESVSGRDLPLAERLSVVFSKLKRLPPCWDQRDNSIAYHDNADPGDSFAGAAGVGLDDPSKRFG